MSGIRSYGVKIPYRRIDAQSIRDVWKNVSEEILTKLNMNERTVTGPDEDAISLGADAARKCFEQADLDVDCIDGLIFASQSNPYVVKSSASVLQDILGLRHGIFVTDVQSSSRSGFDAILIAKSLVDSNQCKNVLIIASDCLNQFISPGHVYEYAAAAGAVALIISNEEVIAEIQDMTFASEDRANWYRLTTERYIQLGCGFVGYISNWGLMDSVKVSWKQYKEKNNVTADDYMHFALPQGTVVQTFMTTGVLNCDPYQAIPYVLSEQTGDMGCAQVLASLCNVFDLIDEADQTILSVGYGWGDGSCVMGLKTTELIANVANKGDVMMQVEKKELIPYAKVLKYEKKLDRNMIGLSSYY